MIKVSDYIVNKLAGYGIEHVFMISGGGAMHLNDSFGSCKDIEYICNHHEQASAIAAEGYSRLNQKLGVVCVTTGPGGINTLNGVVGQWTDSVPVLYISGQVKYETSIQFCPDIPLRQLGDQEADIVSLVKPITKYAETVKNPYEIGITLDKAIYLATHGRQGPVWIDVPMNIQGAMIDEDKLLTYDSSEDEIKFDFDDINSKIQQTIESINKAKRPVIIAGHGIKLSKSEQLFFDLIEKLKIPVVTTFNGFDSIPTNNPLFIGRIGTIGQRAGNFALQNADLVLFLGTRNNIRQISYNWEYFTSKAKRIVIDIDPAELNKTTLSPDIAINADLNYFLNLLNKKISENNILDFSEWLSWCTEKKIKYSPSVVQEYKETKQFINPYFFSLTLSECLQDNSIIVTGNGTASVCYHQAGIVKANQRVLWNSGCASMGYDLPAAIGACIANYNQDVICLAGDGSLMMNIQELQTVKHYNLPIKLFILNNDGYISIRQTQKNFFEGRLTACSRDSGVSLPDFMKVAQAFDLPAKRIEKQEDLKSELEKVLRIKGPVICEIMLDNDYIFTPKLSSEKLPDGKMISKPLEDMYPFLDRDEFNSNMIIRSKI